MAMRRRFFRARRRFGRPVARERVVWVTNNFSETALTSDGTLNEFAVFDPEQSQGGSLISGSPGPSYFTRRILVKGGMAFTPQDTTLTNEQVSLFAALYVIDREDTDGDLVSTDQGKILEGGSRRVLWTDCSAFTIREIPQALNATVFIPSPYRVDIDLKTRVQLRYDDLLIFGLQCSTMSTVVNTPTLSLMCRTLLVRA